MEIHNGYQINNEKHVGQGTQSLVKECQSSKYYNDQLCAKIVTTQGFIPTNQEIFKKIIEFTNLHIVKIFDYFEIKNAETYIIMKHCNGGNLQQKIDKMLAEKKIFEAKEILSFVYQFSQGYFDIHQNKIILKNIKPSKILLHYNLYKLGGFGSKSDNIYSSPQILEQQEYSAKTDMYSLGLIVYHMCFLSLPFNAENLKQFQQQLQHNKFTIQYINGSEEERKEIICLIEKMIVYNENERMSFTELFERVDNLPVYKKYKSLQNLLGTLGDYVVLSDVLQ